MAECKQSRQMSQARAKIDNVIHSQLLGYAGCQLAHSLNFMALLRFDVLLCQNRLNLRMRQATKFLAWIVVWVILIRLIVDLNYNENEYIF